MVGQENVIKDHDEIQPYNVDFTKKYSGKCSLVITPTTTD